MDLYDITTTMKTLGSKTVKVLNTLFDELSYYEVESAEKDINDRYLASKKFCRFFFGTGKYDRNDREIYNGDVIRHPDGFISIVYILDDTFYMDYNLKKYLLTDFEAKSLEIIGDTYNFYHDIEV